MSLVDEIQNDPLGRGYAEMKPDAVLADLQEPRHPDARRVDERTVLAEFPLGVEAANTLLTKLEAVGEENALVGRVLHWLRVAEGQGGGIDVGNQQVRDTLGRVVGTAGITQGEVDALLALAPNTASRLSVLGLPTPRIRDIRQIQEVS